MTNHNPQEAPEIPEPNSTQDPTGKGPGRGGEVGQTMNLTAEELYARTKALCADINRKADEMQATITAQARLLALAETLAGAAKVAASEPTTTRIIGLQTLANAFTAAQAEYQTTGAVPCGECEAKDAEIERLKHGWKVATEQATTCARCLVFKHTPWRAEDGYICAGCMGKENADLRRQLADVHNSEAEIETLTADNAALLEFVAATVEYIEGTTSECDDPETCDCLECGGRRKLTQPHPGAPVLAEVDALRRVEDGLRRRGDVHVHASGCEFWAFGGSPCDCWVNPISELDALRNREGR